MFSKPKLKTLLIVCHIFIGANVIAQEICNNALDDDNDGLIDLNDDECGCGTLSGDTSQTGSSMFPNPSFEEYDCCPTTWSMYGCATDQINPSLATTDYWNGGCSPWPGSTMRGFPFTPMPAGPGVVGILSQTDWFDSWREYAGGCLLQPMTAGTTYELTFWLGHCDQSTLSDPGAPNYSADPINMTFFGTPTCSDIPWPDIYCPIGQGSWIQLGSQVMGGTTGWVQITVSITPPINISALIMGDGCSGSGENVYYYIDDMQLVSTEPVDAVLSISQSGNPCVDGIVAQAQSDSAGGSWQWFKEGIALQGETNSDLGITANNYGAGVYTALYTLGPYCESIDITINAQGMVTADFVITNACFPNPVSFTDQSTVVGNNITEWQWDFGDGTISTLQNPNHTYTIEGIYTVQLTVTSNDGCTSTISQNINIATAPDADFSVPDACLNTDLQFQDISSSGNITSRAWDFGDGNTSSLQNPTYTYTTAGSYNVNLTITVDSACSNTATHVVTVLPTPSANFTTQPACIQTDVLFTDVSIINSGTITDWLWDFGDGNTSTIQNPSNMYTSSGTYSVLLSVTAVSGCQDSIEMEVTVFPRPNADFSVNAVCMAGESVFTDGSSVFGGQIVEWQWDFGDNSGTSNLQNPTYTYPQSGGYLVELIVTTSDGCTDTSENNASVNELPVASFSFENGCEEDSVQFINQSTIPSGNINSWNWNFGNGNTISSETPPYQVYTAEGAYTVSLIVSAGVGCSDTLEQTIEIHPTPEAEFTFNNVCHPSTLQFTDLSGTNGNYVINNWQWVFSNGQSSTEQSPDVNFGSPGIYAAELIITTEDGCKSSYVINNAIVHPSPVADFTGDMTKCLGDTVFFTDNSVITPLTNDVITDWSWNFDDGTSSIQQEPDHFYGQFGLFNVELKVTSNNGCSDSVEQVIEVYPLPDVAFIADPVSGCAPLTVNFTNQSTIPDPYSLSTWDWYLGSSNQTSTTQNPRITYNPQLGPSDSATYDIGLTVTSGNGCTSSIYLSDYVTVYPMPHAEFSVNQDVMNILSPIFEFTDHSSENATIWDWSFGDGNYANIPNPEHTYNAIGIYPIILTVATQHGCSDTASYSVEVEPYFTFYIPNAFTPGTSIGSNDGFYGQGVGYTSYNMRIYNRWGEQIFTSFDDNYHWNGTYNGEVAQEDVYAYYFLIIDWQGGEHVYYGHVTLVR